MAETSRSRTNPSDTYFRILYNWRCKEPSIDHKDKLREIFSAMERQDLIDEMEGFSVEQFVYTGLIVGPEESIDTVDFMAIASRLGAMYYHVVRFLGIEQRTIDQIEADYTSMKEQIYQCLLTIKRMKPGLTRQNFCDALYYAEHADVIETLNSKWKGSWRLDLHYFTLLVDQKFWNLILARKWNVTFSFSY